MELFTLKTSFSNVGNFSRNKDMCINAELEELVENFKQLPELYRHGILGIVRDRKQLYETQLFSSNTRLDPRFQAVLHNYEREANLFDAARNIR